VLLPAAMLLQAVTFTGCLADGKPLSTFSLMPIEMVGSVSGHTADRAATQRQEA